MDQRLVAADLRRQSDSSLVLSDRLIALARDADRAGFTGTAERLVSLAHALLDQRAAHRR
ncbi:MAG TPA: hypothetical protein VMB34_23225 [Acetobacteraceae bacterium]|nr:hypothetical protein [Acetobacteraceae bacterium]